MVSLADDWPDKVVDFIDVYSRLAFIAVILKLAQFRRRIFVSLKLNFNVKFFLFFFSLQLSLNVQFMKPSEYGTLRDPLEELV